MWNKVWASCRISLKFQITLQNVNSNREFQNQVTCNLPQIFPISVQFGSYISFINNFSQKGVSENEQCTRRFTKAQTEHPLRGKLNSHYSQKASQLKEQEKALLENVQQRQLKMITCSPGWRSQGSYFSYWVSHIYHIFGINND